MSAADLLNADLPTVARALRSGWDWWVGELAGMAPQILRRDLRGSSGLTAEPRVGGGYQLRRAGRVVMAAPAGRGALRVNLLLAAHQVLMREAVLPDLPLRDLRRMAALDVDRLTPFQPDAVHVDVARLGPADAPGRLRALIAVVPRVLAAEALAAARTAGLEPRALGVAESETPFDFLPQARLGAAAAQGRARLWAWGVVAVLVAANLAVAIARDIGQTRELRDSVAADRPRLQQLVRLRQNVQAEAARRAAVARQRAASEPLRVLDLLTRAVPAGAWVQRLSFDGKTVRLAGYRQETTDVAASLRAQPLLTNVRNSTSDTPVRSAAGQPFDISADLAPGGRR